MSAGPAICAKPHTGERPRSPPQAATSVRVASVTRPRRMLENLIDVDEGDRRGAHRLERAGRVVVEIIERVGEEQADAGGAVRPASPQVQDLDGDPGLGGRGERDALEATTVAE